MEFVNHSRFPAFLFRTCIDDDRIAASLLLRISYDIRDGVLVPSEEQPWLTSSRALETPYGLMPDDQVFYRGGVDILVFGSSSTPGERKAPHVDVEVEVGSTFRRKARVFGPRVWRRGIAALVPSSPEMFLSIPLQLQYAYGGKESWDGTEIPCPDNPDGMGFYLTEEYAEGRPLPCVEDPAHLITKWSDRPVPVGFGFVPEQSGLRTRDVFRFNEMGKVSCDIAALFNVACPGMVAKDVMAGDPVRLSGMSRSGPVCFKLPESLPRARVRFEARVAERSMAIDQIGIEVARRRAFVSYRYPFRYVVRPHERRIFEIFVD